VCVFRRDGLAPASREKQQWRSRLRHNSRPTDSPGGRVRDRSSAKRKPR
jgi:hypothetical protein